MQLRQHQHELQQYLSNCVTNGEFVKDIIMQVTPGGGKSVIPKIAYHILKNADYVDKLLWIVPRANLRTQGAEDMANKDYISEIGGETFYDFYEAANEIDPSRGTAGFATTYQAISMDSVGINSAELENHRYLVVLDEIHHVEHGGKYHQMLTPILEKAHAKIFMTGTLERGDQKPIAFLPYTEGRNTYAL